MTSLRNVGLVRALSNQHKISLDRTELCRFVRLWEPVVTYRGMFTSRFLIFDTQDD